jgi:hypothetical protein
MAAIRVSICDMPTLLRSMVMGLLDADPDIELVESQHPADAVDADVLLMADVAVSSMQPFEHFWTDGQTLGIVALSGDCQHASIIKIVSHKTPISDNALHTLNLAIRRAASVLAQQH